MTTTAEDKNIKILLGKIVDSIRFIPIQILKEFAYVKNKKSFSPKVPTVVIQKIINCVTNNPEKINGGFWKNIGIQKARTANKPQKHVVINLLYFCFCRYCAATMCEIIGITILNIFINYTFR